MNFLNEYEKITTTLNHLPHWQQDNATYFITYRLGDSIPQVLMGEWKSKRSEWLAIHPKPWDIDTECQYHKIFSAEIDRFLDEGHGACILTNEYFRDVLTESFDHFERSRYHTHARVIMPNHVHLLISLCDGVGLDKVLGSWKKQTAKTINRHLGKSGTLWQKDYFDRIIRDWDHYENVARYIHNNPKKANLTEERYTLWESESVKRMLSQAYAHC